MCQPAGLARPHVVESRPCGARSLDAAGRAPQGRRAGSIFRCRPCGARPHHGWCQPAGLARPDSSSSQLDSYASSTGYHPSWESELAQDLGSSESEVQDQLKVNSASEV